MEDKELECIVNGLGYKRVQAANSGNALEYYSLCVQGGFEPEEQFIELYNQGHKEFIEGHLEDSIDFNALEKNERYGILAEEVKKNHLDPSNVFKNTDIKARILNKVLGYTRLRGEKESIFFSKPTRIGNAFKSACNRASKLGLL